MATSDFTTTLMVDKTPKEVYDAINDVRGWWSENIEGSTDKLDDEYVYNYKDVHYCRIKLVEMIPERKVVWQVLSNYFKFTEDKSEWNGTKVIFDISQQEGKTAIKFTHEGLVPQYECYEICREAWTNYIQESLRDLINSGKGHPNTKEDDSFDAQLIEKWNLA